MPVYITIGIHCDYGIRICHCHDVYYKMHCDSLNCGFRIEHVTNSNPQMIAVMIFYIEWHKLQIQIKGLCFQCVMDSYSYFVFDPLSYTKGYLVIGLNFIELSADN